MDGSPHLSKKPIAVTVKRLRAEISGRVQGVGFRPTVCRHARDLGLAGFVKNTPDGVLVEVQGPAEAADAFLERLRSAPPRQARIEAIRAEPVPAVPGAGAFEIEPSRRSGDLRAGMPPDLATCEDCRAELFDPANRRHLYPFINCVNCGPRFTIIRELPYDRERTSMASFALCPECRKEYRDPADRRFDAQPNACPVCGPRVTLIDGQNKHPTFNPPAPERFGGQAIQHPTSNEKDGGKAGGHSRPPIFEYKIQNAASGIQHPPSNIQHQSTGAAIGEAVRLLKAGGILAVKGLGGYHLACDAASDAAVARLRARKRRPHKSLAVMFAALDDIRRHAEVSAAEAAWLTDCAAPIVILRRKAASTLSRLVSPDTGDIGAFLPYSPLHHLLLAGLGPLVMTSGNLAEEPIAMDEEQLQRILGAIADAALTHNRPILRRCDDSVIKIVGDEFPMEGRASSRPDSAPAFSHPLFFRRSRGFVPDSIRLPLAGPPVLACGADLKNTVCLTRGDAAFLSQHIGDLEDHAAFRFFRETIADLAGLLKIRPALIAHDLHPEYHSTRFALSEEAGAGRRVGVQHHHAHIAACLAEHGLAEKVIGVALDGTGYGPDGTIWGGEFLVADLQSYRRAGHFKYYRMPGGEEAIRHPERMAFSMLRAEGIADTADLLPDLDANQRNLLTAMLEQGIHAPFTSSAGRLFDAAAALLGAGDEVSYEARAAIRLQAMAAGQMFDCRAGTPPGLPADSGTNPAGNAACGTCPPYNNSRKADGAAADPYPFEIAAAEELSDCRAGTPPGLPADSGTNPAGNAACGTCPPYNGLILSFGPMLRTLVADLRTGASRPFMAGRFHATVAAAVVEMCCRIRHTEALDRVALSGGVFQNEILLGQVIKGLHGAGFRVYSHHFVPPNDGCIALGQAVVAASLEEQRGKLDGAR